MMLSRGGSRFLGELRVGFAHTVSPTFTKLCNYCCFVWYFEQKWKNFFCALRSRRRLQEGGLEVRDGLTPDVDGFTVVMIVLGLGFLAVSVSCHRWRGSDPVAVLVGGLGHGGVAAAVGGDHVDVLWAGLRAPDDRCSCRHFERRDLEVGRHTACPRPTDRLQVVVLATLWTSCRRRELARRHSPQNVPAITFTFIFHTVDRTLYCDQFKIYQLCLVVSKN